MIAKINLLNLPVEKFSNLLNEYYSWIEDIEETVFMYIEINRISIDESESLVKILQKYSKIGEDKIQCLVEECSCNLEIKDKIKELYKSDLESEKEWIVFYNHMDIGRRVRAKKYTEALLEAYRKYGADGKITKVEEAKE